MDIWEKIKEHEGETFYLTSGVPLVYKVEGNSISHNRTKVKISKASFEKAVKMNPKSTAELQKVVTGPAYVYAIITDERVL